MGFLVILGNICLFTIDWGGYPIPGLGRGVPQVWMVGGGTKGLDSGGTPSQVWMVGGTPS